MVTNREKRIGPARPTKSTHRTSMSTLYRRYEDGTFLEGPMTMHPRTMMDVVSKIEKSPLEIAYQELRSKLLRKDPSEVENAVWDIYCLADEGKDITPLFSSFSTIMRNDFSSISKTRLMESVRLAAEDGYDVTRALIAVGNGLASKTAKIRATAASALVAYAKNGGDISSHLDTLAKMLNDTFPDNRQSARNALTTYLSQGPEAAHHVLMAISSPTRDENNFAIESLKVQCRKILASAEKKEA